MAEPLAMPGGVCLSARQLPDKVRGASGHGVRPLKHRQAWLLDSSPVISLTSPIHGGQSVSQIPSLLDTVFDGRSSSSD